MMRLGLGRLRVRRMRRTMGSFAFGGFGHRFMGATLVMPAFRHLLRLMRRVGLRLLQHLRAPLIGQKTHLTALQIVDGAHHLDLASQRLRPDIDRRPRPRIFSKTRDEDRCAEDEYDLEILQILVIQRNHGLRAELGLCRPGRRLGGRFVRNCGRQGLVRLLTSDR